MSILEQKLLHAFGAVENGEIVYSFSQFLFEKLLPQYEDFTPVGQ